MRRKTVRALAGVAGALGVVSAVTGAAAAEPVQGQAPAQAPAQVMGGPGAGEILPDPGTPETLLWIPDWIGDGGAVTASVTPTLPFTVTVGCRGGGSVQVHVGGLAPADFTVQCPVEGTGMGSVEIPAREGRDLEFTVHTSDPAIHWGMYAVQPDEQP
ncbi:hypothetical protein [Kitasatospora sp. NPDC097643]|uniref:hypothetical protein n=1 Tax=Kitasatospora sp. NPDC097643 TaxID=3157230 RepID=UPI00332F1860